MKKPVVIFGRGKLAKLLHYYVTHDSDRAVAGFTADRDYCTERSFCDLPVVPFEEIESHFPPSNYALILCLGYANLAYYATIAAIRRARFYTALEKGYELPGYISSRTECWPNVTWGKNVILMEKNIFQPFVKLGDNVIFFGGSTLGHDTVIEDHCFFAGGIDIGGETIIGEGSFLGTNASVLNGLSIGKQSLIGAGSTITRSLGDFTAYSVRLAGVRKISTLSLVKRS